MQSLRFFVVLPGLLAAACATRPVSPGASPAPTPTPVPLRAAENPPDVRARMPLRPTPPQPESRFPPPQQAEADEARTSNPPVEADLLQGEMAVLLDGKPFPEKKTYDPKFPEARRTRYVEAGASGPGDGTEQHPWKDLQEALCKLEPGDRLVLAAGIYTGSFRVSGPCLSGTAAAPIQVFSRHAFLKSGGAGDVLTLERAHWQFWEVQIALLDSDATGLVVTGAEAHDIAVDQSHIYEGKGPAVRIGPGSSRVTLSNCHIHQSNGVRIDAGTSSVTLVNNHIHHNRAASVTVGDGESEEPARAVTLEGNRIHNDRGPGLDLARCEKVIVSRNRFSNYRPGEEEDEKSEGEAVRVRSACRDVEFERNSVLESTVGVRIGDAGEAQPEPPEQISFHHNYFENRLTPDSTAFRLDRGSDLRVYNNVIDRYAEPFVIAPGVQRAWIANNLVLAPRNAFTLLSPDAVVLFDYNVFGAPAGLPAAVGGDRRIDTAAWIKSHMPHSKLTPGAGLAERDLDRILGFSPVDAGSAAEGIPFEGKAPDIGVAER